jgi:energy-coupling factor transporter transmembrane protein EcfT
MIAAVEVGDVQLRSVLGRTSPLVKLGVALLWLVGLAFTRDPRPPLVLAALALAAGLILGRIPAGRLVLALAPLTLTAVGIAVFNTLFSASNTDPAATELVRILSWRIVAEAVAAGVGLGCRILAIVAVGVVFGLTTDSTRLVDSLVRQGRVPDRFAYGALAAYQAIPRFAEDLLTLRQARRIRGLRGSWHPRLLVGLLVLAIRHGDRLALAMDARAFGSGPRTWYRPLAWGWLDAVVGVVGVLALAGALALAAG